MCSSPRRTRSDHVLTIDFAHFRPVCALQFPGQADRNSTRSRRVSTGLVTPRRSGTPEWRRSATVVSRAPAIRGGAPPAGGGPAGPRASARHMRALLVLRVKREARTAQCRHVRGESPDAGLSPVALVMHARPSRLRSGQYGLRVGEERQRRYGAVGCRPQSGPFSISGVFVT